MEKTSNNVQIKYTEVFESTVDSAIQFIQSYSDYDKAFNRIGRVIDSFESKVREHPKSCPVCFELAELGITNYREFNSDGFRILYTIEMDGDSSIIFGELLLNQRQSIQQQLINYCLLS